MCSPFPDISSAASHTASPEVSAELAAVEQKSAAECAVEQFIHSRINFERLPTERYGLADFRLDRIRSLLARLGDPQRQPAVHIAGTKGKGSTAAMIATMAQTGGHRVGLFTSPHMIHVGERMIVNGALPSDDELMNLLTELVPAIESLDREGPRMRATFFEVLTAMGWLHFRNRRVDLVVLETGLGGRLDATNVCEPLVCLITSISRDHERLLGSTLEEIAGEKAGILKPGVPAISGVCNEVPRGVIRKYAARVKAPLHELGESIRVRAAATLISDPTTIESDEPQFATVDVRTPWRSHHGLRAPLAGAHQANNLALAVAAIDFLDAAALRIPPAAIAEGLRRVQWPLRVEVIARHPLVIVDAAHNVASITALVEALTPVAAAERVLIFGTARDKDTAGMLQQLAGEFDRVILTRFVNNPRGVSRPQMEALARDNLQIPWTWAEDPSAAWQAAAETTGSGGLICATGSFFLASEFRTAVAAAQTRHRS
jgi:dihydrofolate synthase / folylpolyglutamate synthase